MADDRRLNIHSRFAHSLLSPNAARHRVVEGEVPFQQSTDRDFGARDYSVAFSTTG